MAAAGLNPSETARALGMPVGTVFGRLRSARRLLAREVHR
jgi:DNA-directed RNA polymerase specialized sigma24 family protein